MFGRVSIAFAVTLVLVSNISAQTDEPINKHFGTYEPVFLAELWRHGARAAAKNTFNQEYVDQVGAGLLQPNGIRMHYVLGRQISTTWKDNIFNGVLKNSDFEIHSSEYQRTILSAESHAYGLFPPGSGLKVTNLDKDPKIALPSYKDIDINVSALGQNALPSGYRPIPVAVSLVTNDNLFMKGMKFNCKAAEDKLEAASKKAFEENKNLLDRFKVILEKTEQNQYVATAFKDLGGAWNTQTIGIFSDINKCYQYYANKPMAGTEDIFPWMKYIFGVYYFYENFPDAQITKLITTNMAKRILEKMEAQMNPTSKKIKYLGLSGHEFNIFPFMMGYDLMNIECLKKNALEPDQAKWDKKCKGSPEFAANIVWELSKKKKLVQPGRRLLQDSTDFFVRVFYDGEPIDFCGAAATPEKYCKYEDFKKHLTSKFILSDAEYKSTCTGTSALSVPVPAPIASSISPAWMWVDFFLIAAILVVVTLMIMKFASSSKSGSNGIEMKTSNFAEN